MTEWQRIETAPRDGSLILLGCENDPAVDFHTFWVGIGAWCDDGFFLNCVTDDGFEASHWAPITSPIPGAEPVLN